MEENATHGLLRDLVEKIYRETGVMIEHVSFNWYNPGVGASEGACCVLETKIDSTKPL